MGNTPLPSSPIDKGWLLLALWGCGQRACVVHISTGHARAAFSLGDVQAALGVELAELDRAVHHAPLAAVDGDQPDRLADQRLAEEHPLAAPADLAVRAHQATRLGGG